MQSNNFEEVLSHMREYINREVKAGFSKSDEIFNSAIEVFSDEYPPSELSSYAKEFIQESIASQLREQDTWGEITDCDRLDQAFENLEKRGIISRQNFSCCGTCGSAEILDEIEIAKNNGKPANGYTFYHVQDTEGALEGEGLFLSYGSINNNYFAQIFTGYKIVKTLKNYGLQIQWNGSLRRRIFVKLEWKRRQKTNSN